MRQSLIRRPAGRIAVAAVALSALLAASAVPAFAAPAADSAYFKGTVRGVDGAPLGSVAVTAGFVDIDLSLHRNFAAVYTTVTHVDGTYRLRVGIFPEPLRIQFGAAHAVGGTSTTGYGDHCFGGVEDCAADAGRDFSVAAGDTYTTSASLGRAAAVKGRLIDDGGHGIGGELVGLYHPPATSRGSDGPAFARVRTDADGHYRIPRVATERPVTVCFGESPPHEFVPVTPAADGYTGFCTADPVTLRPGAAATRNGTLRERGGVKGTFVDDAGQPLADVTFVMFDNSPGFWTARTNSAGFFHVPGVDAGVVAWCVMTETDYTDTCGFKERFPLIVVTAAQTLAMGKVVLAPF